MIAEVSCSSFKRTKLLLLLIVIVASLIKSVRLKDQNHFQQQENDHTSIRENRFSDSSTYFAAHKSIDTLEGDKNLEMRRKILYTSNMPNLAPTSKYSVSSVSNSLPKKSEELGMNNNNNNNNRTFNEHQDDSRSLLCENCGRNSSSEEPRVTTSSLREDGVEEEEAQVKTNAKFTIFNNSEIPQLPRTHMFVVGSEESRVPSVELEKSHSSIARKKESTMAGEQHNKSTEDRERLPYLPYAGPLSTLNIPKTTTTTTTEFFVDKPNMSSRSMSQSIELEEESMMMRGRGSRKVELKDRSDIKSRSSRSLQSSSSSSISSQEQEAVMMMSSIQSVVGQPLTIPCANQTGEFPLTAPNVPLSGHQSAATATIQHLRGSTIQHNGNGNRQRGGKGGKVANGQGISLIVWHKDDQMNSPIFTVDARKASSLREAKQQTGLESLKGRAHLEESTRVDSRGFGSTPALVIDEANVEDGGVYTCTVEFYKAPTQTHQIRVLLINPPQNMIVQDQQSNRKKAPEGGQQISFGPYDEESPLKLLCEAEAGDPPAQVSWWQLASVSSLPPSSTQRASSSSSRPLEAFDSSAFQSSEVLMTILQTFEQNGGLIEDSQTKLKRDYFVALHSATTTNSLASVLSEFPFHSYIQSDGNQQRFLRHWTRVKDQISSNDPSSNGGKIRSTMEISSLSRTNFGDEFLCIARNNDFSAPLNASLKLDLNLKPIDVKINVNKTNHLLRMGQKSTIECQVFGSRPAAKIRWFKGSTELESSTNNKRVGLQNSQEEQQQQFYYISELIRDINNNLTKISYLTIVPQLSDNQQSLTCSASNTKLPNVPPLSDSITMNVLYPAQMSLQFGSSIKQEQIRLGSDVFMDCVIQSNPPIDDLTWLFNGQPLSPNASAGIIMSDLSLVIQGIRIEHRGKYQCLGQNSLGKFASNKLELKPKFKPVCDYSLTKTKYKIAVNQVTKIECGVLAEPDDDINFYWQFNQTSDSSMVLHPLKDLKQYETNFTRSYLNFTPESKRHYGQLLCSASNTMGKQEKPCVIQVFPSELPDPVFSCFFDTFTNTSFNVHCQSSELSSSLRQTYLLELYSNESSMGLLNKDKESTNYQPDYLTTSPMTHLKQRNHQEDTLDDEQIPSNEDQQQQQQLSQQQVKILTSEIPSFQVTELKPDTAYNVMIYVQNSKGRSVPVFHPASTLPSEPNSDPLGSLKGGQIQFSSTSNKRSQEGGQESLFDRMTGYLRISEYLNGDSSTAATTTTAAAATKPLFGIALIVLLCTITAVTLTFFVVRVCRPSQTQSTGSNNDRLSHRKRQRSKYNGGRKSSGGSGGGGLVNGLLEGVGGGGNNREEKLRTYDGKEPQLDRSVQLNLATPSRLKALAGSGSDTSRETNTDSTLISLFRPVSRHENSTMANGTGADNKIGQLDGAGRRTSFGGSTNETIQLHNCPIDSNLNYPPRPSSNLVNGSLSMVNTMAQVRFNEQQQQQHQQKLHSVYSTIKRSAAAAHLNSSPGREMFATELNISTTPQISIQSGSDCTTSNNELQGDVSEFHDQLLIKCRRGEDFLDTVGEGNDEPVYVIGRDGQLTGQCVGRQLRILNHHHHQPSPVASTGFWPTNYSDQMSSVGGDKHNGSVSGGTQVSSSNTADSFDQQRTPTITNSSNIHLVSMAGGCHQPMTSETLGGGGSSGGSSHELPIPISFLPNSVSIPASLAAGGGVGECPHHVAASNYHHRQLSHEFLATQDLCLTSQSTVGPFLTLAPATDQAIRYQRSYGYLQEQQQQQQSRVIPYSDNYGSMNQQQKQDQLVATLANFAPANHYHCENAPIEITDGVSFPTYHANTLDDTYRRQSRAQTSPMIKSGGQTMRQNRLTQKPQQMSMDGGNNRSDDGSAIDNGS